MKITNSTHQACVEAIKDVTPTVREFTLRLPVDAPVSALQWQPGVHIQVHLLVNGRMQTRHYSLLPPVTPGCLRIAVKRVQPGRGGSRAMWELQVEQVLTVSEPLNQFPLDLAAPAYFLIAGGIGITPIFGMAQRLFERQANARMLYCASSAQEFAFLTDLQTQLGNRLETVTGHLQDLDARIALLPDQAQAYVCGPLGLLQMVQLAWERAGRSPTLLRFETFGAASSRPEPFQVILPRYKLEIAVDEETSLLDALELEGIQAMYGCRKGECGLCVLPVLSLKGQIQHHDIFLSEHEKQSNQKICICVSRVKGCITLDTAYRPENNPQKVSTLTA